MIPEEEYGQLAMADETGGGSDNDQEETIEFISYAESDDDDEDPYFMPEHNKRTSIWTFSSLSCSPIQVLRFMIPTVCILTIIIYTIVIGVLTEKKKNKI